MLAGVLKSNKKWFILFHLLKNGALVKPIKTSTVKLARELDVSQQTISRYLIKLEGSGLIERRITQRGEIIRVTDKGLEQVLAVYTELKRIFEGRESVLILEGVVFSGVGEGAYYLRQEGYRRQFIAKLGFDPYPGTLNLKLTSISDIIARKSMEFYPGITITGFKTKERSFGAVKCFKAAVNGQKNCAVILAERTHYDASVLEVIAPFSLRERLGLRDGDKITVRVYLAY